MDVHLTKLFMIPDDLKLEAHTQNETARILFSEASNVLAQMSKYIDKKIFTANDERAKIFNPEYLNILANAFKGWKGTTSTGVSVQNLFIDRSNCRISLRIRLCFSAHSADRQLYCRYTDKSVTIGMLDENTKQFLVSVPELSTIEWLNDEQIDPSIEYKKILKYKALINEAEKIQMLVDRSFYQR